MWQNQRPAVQRSTSCSLLARRPDCLGAGIFFGKTQAPFRKAGDGDRGGVANPTRSPSEMDGVWSHEDITPIKDDTVASWRRHLGDPANLTSAQVEPWVRNSLLSNRRTPRLRPKAARTLQVIREDLGTYQGLSLKTYGGDSRAVRIVFYAHFHRISRRSAATLHPLATAAARCRRDHERRHGDASSASCGLDVPHSQPEESNCFG